MSIFVTSDPHVGHANILKYCSRPFASVEEMNQALIDNINSVATENDVLICCGDFSFLKEKEVEVVLACIKPKFVLVKGNHDRVKTLQKAGLTTIADECYLTYKGVRFWFNHYPAIRSQYDIETGRVMQRPQPKQQWDVLIHGHSHTSSDKKIQVYQNKLHIDIGVDGNNYRPYSLDEIIEISKNLEVLD